MRGPPSSPPSSLVTERKRWPGEGGERRGGAEGTFSDGWLISAFSPLSHISEASSPPPRCSWEKEEEGGVKADQPLHPPPPKGSPNAAFAPERRKRRRFSSSSNMPRPFLCMPDCPRPLPSLVEACWKLAPMIVISTQPSLKPLKLCHTRLSSHGNSPMTDDRNLLVACPLSSSLFARKANTCP